MCDHLFVVTGGPGSGKTSLIEALALKGIQHMPEAGRAIIQDQVRIKGNALPWAD
ncbi:MAG: ATPase, partial [Mesorhizobium sp.]